MGVTMLVQIQTGVQKNKIMRLILIVILASMCTLLFSCAAGKGCPSSGRNVGAEKILSGDPKAIKDMKKARKFRA
jgi:hypothetical protein